jgi:NADH-quinone oxidoreductase subunit J
MIIQTIMFYVLAVGTVGAGVMVIASRNPVHSVLFLILAFFNSAGLFVMMGAEFLAMILIIVYVGAVAVLFLFVVMMLDINFAELRAGFLQYLPIGGVIGIILLAELVMVFASGVIEIEVPTNVASPTPPPDEVTNTQALGDVLYTRYAYLFQGAGFILLIAMVGAIVLTHRRRTDVRRQRIADQVARDPKAAVRLTDIEPGAEGTWKSD